MHIKQKWFCLTSNWLLKEKYGEKIIYLRKEHGKKVYDIEKLPQYVLDAFDVDLEHGTISMFTSDDAIRIMEKNGAIVEKIYLIEHKITFVIELRNYKRKNNMAKERAKNASRDYSGKFVKNSPLT
jgi:hypothetical protein